MSGLVFAWEKVGALVASGILDLATRHYAEIALDQDLVPLDVDVSDYLARERAGIFRTFTARRCGVLVGYVQWYLYRPARCRTTLFADEAAYWLASDERRGLNGFRFLEAAVAALPRPCVVQVREKETFKNGRVASLLARLGLTSSERVFRGFLEG